MATFGIAMVKDEADVIEETIRHMADEVDELIVSDNMSTDGTREILADLAEELPLTVLDDFERAYYQSDKMSRLAATAAERGARWIVPFDADEIWLASDRLSIVLAGLNGAWKIARADLFNHFCTAIDPADGSPFQRIPWRQAVPGALPKVAFRWESGARVLQGNHGVILPSGNDRGAGVLQVRHFPYRSAEQFVRKAINGAAAYAATDLHPAFGAHWRAYGEIYERLGRQGLEDVFREHFWYLSPTDSGLILDPAPHRRWQQ